ncbi:diguanylate cyclase [Roseateles sp. UC29_93]|uniref:GGDEF domain-containing response regulator n=1 Tax=Roseateles sp. UC29_93 TaxID=3350177 RepID=UPI0002F64D46
MDASASLPPASLPPLRILVVDDQASTRGFLCRQLQAIGHHTLEADGGDSALARFDGDHPDLVLLDVEMPDHDGYWVASQMRAHENGGWTPIIFLSSRDRDQDLWQGIESGGDDYLVKPVSNTVLQAKLRAMQRLRRMQTRLQQVSDDLRHSNERLEKLSGEDPLTRLMNRRAFDARLAQEIACARRDQQPLTLVLCDIDHFKRYNDSYGHLAGDACLQRVARLLQETCRRPRDCAARYGGEEFALILPGTPRSGAMTFARAVMRTLRNCNMRHPDSVEPHVTLSGGITTCVPDADTSVEGLLRRSDDALYTAKSRGRNRFFSFEMQMDTVEQAPSGFAPL